MDLSIWLKSEKHRHLVQRWWILLVFLWDVAKTFVIDKTFATYGVNPYVYLAIVTSIAVPYALTTARMLFAFVENNWRKAILYGFAAVTLHFLPDVYILKTVHHPPQTLLDGFLIVLVLFTLFAIRGIYIQVRFHRKS